MTIKRVVTCCGYIGVLLLAVLLQSRRRRAFAVEAEIHHAACSDFGLCGHSIFKHNFQRVFPSDKPIFDFHGKDLSLELDGHLKSEGGYLKFDPVAGKLGSLPLPKSTLDSAVEKLMNSPENREKLKLPSDISDVQIEDGQAKVRYE